MSPDRASLLVGLGNPGSAHRNQRHNAGRLAIEAIASLHGFTALRARLPGESRQGFVNGHKAIFFAPTTYMNDSGRAVRAARDYFGLDNKKLFIFHDELDLRPGKIRVKRGGGAGGHNGLRDLDLHIGPDYWRVRIGIGHPGDRKYTHDYVLGNFTKTEQGWVKPVLEEMAELLPHLLGGDPGLFMSEVARLVPFQESPK